MIGAELVLDADRTMAKALRDSVEERALDNGLLILGCGFNTLRFCPPLNIDRATVEEGLVKFEKSLTEAEQLHGLL
jgi:4-aminobutyrate aminotransferase-like enzyme